MTSVTEINFFDDGSVANFTLLGELDGVPGYSMRVPLEDNGEPGSGCETGDSPDACDTIRFVLTGSSFTYDSCGWEVSSCAGDFPGNSSQAGTARTFLDKGNLQVPGVSP